MSAVDDRAVSGVGLLGLLGTALVALKLSGVIGLSWTWVLAPFWMPFAVALLIGLFALLDQALEKVRRR